jgi:hypothetical protein
VSVREDDSHEAAMAGNEGVRIMERYPSMSKASAIIKVFARPIFTDKALMKKAAATKPAALQTKMIATVP